MVKKMKVLPLTKFHLTFLITIQLVIIMLLLSQSKTDTLKLYNFKGSYNNLLTIIKNQIPINFFTFNNDSSKNKSIRVFCLILTAPIHFEKRVCLVNFSLF